MPDDHNELLAEVQTNCERWVAAVATDDSLSGVAAQSIRNEIARLATALRASEQARREAMALAHAETANATATIDTLIQQRDEAQETVRLFEITYGDPNAVRDLAAANDELAATRQELAEARKDSERLDWLELYATSIVIRHSAVHPRGDVISTERAAIDAARKEGRDE